MVLPILQPLMFQVPWASSTIALNSVVSIFCIVLLLARVVSAGDQLFRPAALLAGLVIVFYQLPMALMADALRQSLPNFLALTVCVHALVLVLVGWLYLTRKVAWLSLMQRDARGDSKPFTGMVVWLPLLCVIAFGAMFLNKIPYACSGLSALLVEPNITLLVREMTIKLSGSSPAFYAYGVMVNALCPWLLFVAIWNGWHALRARRMLPLLACVALAGFAFSWVMMTGTKGNVIASFMVLIAGLFVAMRHWRQRLMVPLLGALALVALLTGFEMMIERSDVRGNYPLEKCVVQMKLCEPSKDFFASMTRKEGSLGLAHSQIIRLGKRVARACQGLPATTSSVRTYAAKTNIVRAEQLSYAVIYRAFVVPVQVASWHYLYVHAHGSPGAAALPLARHIIGESISMPQLVYQQYGVIFSDGDSTSTSTAPTGFIIAYPLYFGLAGLLATLFVILVFDVLATILLRLTQAPLRFVATGLLVVICYNMLLSDFVGVLLSHGGLFAGLLVALCVAAQRRKI